jgi:hypothetical protein
MWLMIGFTLGTALVTMHQFRYWRKAGGSREKWVFAGWMAVAWLTGILFMAGILKFPTPTAPPFPAWK